MTGPEIVLILFIFVFQMFWLVCLYIRHGQLSQKIEAFERALQKQVELNDSVQNGFVAINTSINERFAAVAERLNTDDYRD